MPTHEQLTDQPTDPQGKAYSDGWRDYALRRTAGGAAGTDNRFYRMGWADHQRRDQIPAMYARKERA